jgi:hypothetical protein
MVKEIFSWMALFNACRIYDNEKMVKHIVNFFL